MNTFEGKIFKDWHERLPHPQCLPGEKATRILRVQCEVCQKYAHYAITTPTRNRRNGREHATRTSHFLSRRSFKRDFYGHSAIWTVGKITETQIFEGKWFFYVCSCDICRLIILLLFNAGSATRGDNSGRRLES